MLAKARKYLGQYLLNRSLQSQRMSPLDDPSLWGLSVNGSGCLGIGDWDAPRLVREHGSPLLVVNHRQLHRETTAVANALAGIGRGSRVLYSYKTNCIPGILKEIHRAGIGAEVVSPYELWLARKLEVPGDQVIYNGVNKTEESLVSAVEMGILAVNIDGIPEIARLAAIARHMKRKVRVGIRLGFLDKAQFGLEIASGEAMEGCRRIAANADVLEMTCVHFCVTSNARNASTHIRFATQALDFVHGVKEQTGLTVRYLDVGGGIGVPTSKNMTGAEYGLYRLFGCLPTPPDPADYEEIDTFIARLDAAVREKSAYLNIAPPGIIVEPGRFVTSRAEFLLSTVLGIKEKKSGLRYAITDAGRLSVTFPCEFEYHQIFPADRPGREKTCVYNIMGRICTSADWMARNRLLPELREGDILATMDAGAYFSSYSTNFAFPRPPIVMVKDGKSEIIRSGECYEHLTRLDRW
jgi:diaminopimelate decarboxylase